MFDWSLAHMVVIANAACTLMCQLGWLRPSLMRRSISPRLAFIANSVPDVISSHSSIQTEAACAAPRLLLLLPTGMCDLVSKSVRNSFCCSYSSCFCLSFICCSVCWCIAKNTKGIYFFEYLLISSALACTMASRVSPHDSFMPSSSFSKYLNYLN